MTDLSVGDHVPTVVLVGTFDTKGTEYAFVRDRLREHGVAVLTVDTGILGQPTFLPDIGREEVARTGGTTLDELITNGDRGAAVTVMGEGAAAIVARLHAEGRVDGVFGLGGSGGSSIVARAVRDLPVGLPKLIVSTVASGDTRPYVGTSDLTMMYSVVDIAGINSLSRRILINAAAAIAGMARVASVSVPSNGTRDAETTRPAGTERPLVAATMFGVTTPAVTTAREWLEERGYEVLVFHATGAGGDTMERLVRDGIVTGVLDITTTELADELADGTLPAGPGRFEGAGLMGFPQVVSLGALDMVNFGPKETVPAHYADRQLLVHNANITLMRTTPEENAELGRRLAERLNRATGPLTVFIPGDGVSLVSQAGGPFHDPAADAALVEALRAALDPAVDVVVLDTALNNPTFAIAMAERFHALYQRWATDRKTQETTR
ncbi:MAG TPA: Tm-1-like ATP-binding domain-containing protein [Thermomicrobiales bacterium]|nr:Tm-1-like ATP-binding domain-containing protein [Thermomicrobiales bacterium]